MICHASLCCSSTGVCHFFWSWHDLGTWKNLQILFCGIFAENLCVPLSVSSSLKRSQLQLTNIKRLANFSFACSWVWCTSQHKCQRSHIFRCIDESFLCARWTPYGSEDNRQRIQVSACLSCFISDPTLTECLRVVKTWRCWFTFVKWAQNLHFSCNVIFRIQMVHMELLANCG